MSSPNGFSLPLMPPDGASLSPMLAEVPRLLERLPKVLPVTVRKDGDGKIRLLAPRRG